MFRTLQPAAPDAIFGLSEAFQHDSNPNKINLAVGVFKDENGQTPILESVKEAEHQILNNEMSKGYLPIDGSANYDRLIQGLILGENHPALQAERIVTAQTPGGTGALRMAADLVRRIAPQAKIWISEPTWANHPNIFATAGLEVRSYPYFDDDTNQIDPNGMLAAIEDIPAGDILLLHGCCHNPTGADLSLELWRQVAAICRKREIIPLIDFAYQGFGQGIEEDGAGLRMMAEETPTLMIASSASKNFGLYNERTGAISLIAPDPKAAQAGLSHLKRCIRTSYSNPPAHGAEIVSTILSDPSLRQKWREEVDGMRQRIQQMRDLFVESLNELGVSEDFGYIRSQRGMFSYSGLSPEQVQDLRQNHSIYIVGSGRINVAGMNHRNIGYLCESIAQVLTKSEKAAEPERSR